MRNGPGVFACDGRMRATVTASWYRQMSFPNVYAVDGGTNAWVTDAMYYLVGCHAQLPWLIFG